MALRQGRPCIILNRVHVRSKSTMNSLGVAIGYGLTFLIFHLFFWSQLNGYFKMHLSIAVISGLYVIGHGVSSLKNDLNPDGFSTVLKVLGIGVCIGAFCVVSFSGLSYWTIHLLFWPWWFVVIYGIIFLFVIPIFSSAFNSCRHFET